MEEAREQTQNACRFVAHQAVSPEGLRQPYSRASDASFNEAGHEAVTTHQIAIPRQNNAVTITHRGRLGPAWSSAET